MTDPNVQPKFWVNGNPNVAQAAALVRQVFSALGLIVAAFGLAKEAGLLNHLADLAVPIVTVAGGIVGLGAMVWGSLHTRREAKIKAELADAAPAEVAQIK